MNQPTAFEITEADMPTLEKAIEEALRQSRELSKEHEARLLRIAALGAETDAMLEQIKIKLAYVEEHLRTPLSDLHV
jgi:hypothetical protein